jgi:MoaA/NifB/PqqE/SkfB family radical SAM enzyme
MKRHRLKIELKEKIKKVESLMWFHCNNNCIFCSWGHKRNPSGSENYAVATTKEIMEDIDYAASIGAKLFSFSGGEPTIRRDLVELVKYAKKRNIKNIQIQTNGRMLVYKDQVKKLMEAGVNDFAVTILSRRESVHDKLTAAKGSFKQVMRGIKNINAARQNIRLRLNIVITKFNFKDLPELTNLLLKLKPSEIGYNFVIIDGYVLRNPGMIVPRYKDVKPYLLKALNISAAKVWTPVFNIPHCLMGRFAGKVVDFVQPGTLLIAKDFYFSIKENRRENKIKLANCKLCHYNKLCFGVWEKYINLYGDSEFKPVIK